ncbi:hypothetical protein ACF0H5_001519 [Mactra antiquata]
MATSRSGHRHCYVPLCVSGERYSSELSFHRFPKDEKTKRTSGLSKSEEMRDLYTRLYAAKKAKRIPSKVWGNFKLTDKHSKAYEPYLKYSDKPHYLRKHLYNAENPHSDEQCSL